MGNSVFGIALLDNIGIATIIYAMMIQLEYMECGFQPVVWAFKSEVVVKIVLQSFTVYVFLINRYWFLSFLNLPILGCFLFEFMKSDYNLEKIINVDTDLLDKWMSYCVYFLGFYGAATIVNIIWVRRVYFKPKLLEQKIQLSLLRFSNEMGNSVGELIGHLILPAPAVFGIALVDNIGIVTMIYAMMILLGDMECEFWDWNIQPVVAMLKSEVVVKIILQSFTVFVFLINRYWFLGFLNLPIIGCFVFEFIKLHYNPEKIINIDNTDLLDKWISYCIYFLGFYGAVTIVNIICLVNYP